MRNFLLVCFAVVVLAVVGISWGKKDKSEPMPIGLCVPVSGVTNASGVFSYTFPNAYVVPPNIQANVLNGTDKYNMVTTVSTTGFTVKVTTRNAATLLGLEVLLATTSNVVGAPVDVLLTAKQ